MQLSPRYGDNPIMVTQAAARSMAVPLLRQRRRLADTLAALDDDQWTAQSRCSEWSVKDVILHLNSTNGFWAFSFARALAGEPTEFLATFDPVASPMALVQGMGDPSPKEVLDAFVESIDAMAAITDAMTDEQWALPGEAPPGHISLELVGWHALWDAWVHERDIALPLGLPVAVEPDEVAGCLRYALALSPAFSAAHHPGRQGSVGLVVTDPGAAFTVDAGATVVIRDEAPGSDVPCLRGDAVAVLEGLSHRLPLVHGLGADDAWLVEGLAEVFDIT